MRLAPAVLMRANVGRFTKVAHSGDQVARVNQDAVRDTVVTVAAVVIRSRRKYSGERIDPGARANAVLVAIQTGGVRIRASRAEVLTCYATTGVTSSADALFQCKERMFHP